jgi:FAD binding domain
MVPVICPRLYSIASSPLHREDKLDLLVVLNEWKDSKGRNRSGLTTQFLFGAKPDIKVAVQIRRGILQPPENPESPILMFGLGTVSMRFRFLLLIPRQSLTSVIPPYRVSLHSVDSCNIDKLFSDLEPNWDLQLCTLVSVTRTMISI